MLRGMELTNVGCVVRSAADARQPGPARLSLGRTGREACARRIARSAYLYRPFLPAPGGAVTARLRGNMAAQAAAARAAGRR